MYLTESERKRIKALHEASSASAAGSYETPMGFKAERPEIVGELPDEMDMGISDDEGVVMDVDELIGMLGLSEEEDKVRMRQLHKDNSVVVEQEIPEITYLCSECIKKALGKYSDKAEDISTKIAEALSDNDIEYAEFMDIAKDVLKVVLEVSFTGIIDAPAIAIKLWKCKEDCN